jgi:hypothetical protein
MTDSGKTKITWYLRRGGQQAGPFSSAAVRRLLAQDQVSLDDEVSRDRKSWKPVREVAEVVPPHLRPEGETGDSAPSAPETATPWRSILVSALIVTGILGFGLWSGSKGPESGADCAAPPRAGVDWRNCRLQGARVTGGNLQAASLQNANLSESTFTGTDLSGAQLDYADLGRADLAYTSLRGASLRGANLRNADLTNADLRGADFSFADLSAAVMAGATLENTRFDKAVWRDGRNCRTGSVDVCIPENPVAPSGGNAGGAVPTR